jgi:hypothetical protein
MSDLDSSVALASDPQAVRRKRVLLGDWSNGKGIDRGQCLVVEGGPLWDALTVIDRTTEATRVRHPVHNRGARV